MKKGIAPLVLAGVIAGGSLVVYTTGPYVTKGVVKVAKTTAHLAAHVIRLPKKAVKK